MQKIISMALAVIAVGFMAGCQSSEVANEGRLQVKTTVYPLTYLVEAIGGDAVEVESILPAGADAHDYEPTQQEIIRLGESDVFFYLGIGDQELLVDELAAVLTNEKVTFMDAAENITTIQGSHSHEEHEEHDEDEEAHDETALSADPHIWLDPVRMAKMAENVYMTLSEQLPDEATQLRENYEEIQTKLEALDQEYVEVLQGLENTHLLVTHNAYGYWEDRYGVEIIALSDLTNNAELTQQEIIAINEEIVAKGVKAIFTAPNIQSQYAKNFIQQFNLSEFSLQNLETLSASESQSGADYFTIMQANLAALAEGFALQNQ
ncbi:MAG: metal ABC transporter solute-binding protein, Zn/Mn family [Culicoidibacterales bacterium]